MAFYKRKTYLINPKFQIKFSLYIAIFFALSTVIYPLLIFDIYGEVVALLGNEFPTASQNFADRRSQLLVLLALWQLTFVFLVFLVAIFIGHKIAGPLYKVKKEIDSLSKGNKVEKVNLRKGDYFQELAVSFNLLLDKLQKREEK